jgi:hypothetical protein
LAGYTGDSAVYLDTLRARAALTQRYVGRYGLPERTPGQDRWRSLVSLIRYLVQSTISWRKQEYRKEIIMDLSKLRYLALLGLLALLTFPTGNTGFLGFLGFLGFMAFNSAGKTKPD